jgi:hypothetical protein
MKYGVVYKHKPNNKINGTFFYCFEYFQFLKKFVDVKFYIVDISEKDINLISKIFTEKYTSNFNDVVPIKIIDLYKLKLDQTLILDVMTFYDCKEFLTNQIHCYSNNDHSMFRYKNNRTVTYYGSYSQYQKFDIFSHIKFNFDIFRKLTKNGHGVFISALNQEYIRCNINRWQQEFGRPIIIKKSHSGQGNMFEHIDGVHYVHTQRDTNNRIIPEAFFYGKTVTIEDLHPEIDSIKLRYEDILANGLKNYTLTEDDIIIQAMIGNS